MGNNYPKTEIDEIVEIVVEEYLNDKIGESGIKFNSHKKIETYIAITIGVIAGSIIAVFSNKSNLKTRVDSLEERIESLENEKKRREK